MTGRPTIFRQEMIEEAEHYMDNYESFGDIIPSVVGLCDATNLKRSTLYQWCEDPDHPFADILEKINMRQERKLLNGGLSGELNSNITKLALGKHGYHEKKDHEHKAFIFQNEKGDEDL